MPTPAWFKGICDAVLAKVKIWYAAYETGEVYSTRKWLDPQDNIVKDLPTRFAHKIAWDPKEMEHLVRILSETNPESAVTADMKKVYLGLRRGQMLPGGRYIVTLAFWKEDIKEILDALERAKNGGKTDFDDLKEDKHKVGKDLWEI